MTTDDDRVDALLAELQTALDDHDQAEVKRIARALHAAGWRAEHITLAPAGADDIEAARARAWRRWIDAAARVHAGDFGAAQYELNATTIALRDIERQRRISGRLTTAARDLQQLARDARDLARIEFSSHGRTRFYFGQRWFALCQSATALHYRTIAAVLRPFGL